MKKHLLLLFLASPLFGAVGAVVYSGPTVVAKIYCSGSSEVCTADINNQASDDILRTYQVFYSTDPLFDSEFTSVAVSAQLSPSASAWKTCVTANAVPSLSSESTLIHCIAKQLGYE